MVSGNRIELVIATLAAFLMMAVPTLNYGTSNPVHKGRTPPSNEYDNPNRILLRKVGWRLEHVVSIMQYWERSRPYFNSPETQKGWSHLDMYTDEVYQNLLHRLEPREIDRVIGASVRESHVKAGGLENQISKLDTAFLDDMLIIEQDFYGCMERLRETMASHRSSIKECIDEGRPIAFPSIQQYITEISVLNDRVKELQAKYSIK